MELTADTRGAAETVSNDRAVTGPGLGQNYWVALCAPAKTATEADITAMLSAHLSWLRSVDERNLLFMAGPLRSGPGVRMGSGMMIFRATGRAEAEAIASQDPFVTAGLRTSTYMSGNSIKAVWSCVYR